MCNISCSSYGQVFCVNDTCLSRWQRNSPWDLKKGGGRQYNWSTETVSLHLVIPKPTPDFVSPKALKHSMDMIGDVGRRILEKSGRMSILEKAEDLNKKTV